MQNRAKKILACIAGIHCILIAMIALPISFSSCSDVQYEVIPVNVIEEADTGTAPSGETDEPQRENPVAGQPTQEERPFPTPDPVQEKQTPDPGETAQPQRRLRTADEIRRTATLDPITPSRQKTNSTRSIDSTQLEKQLQSRLDQIASAVTVTSESGQRSGASVNNYAKSILGPILYRRWAEPSLRETGGARPSAAVELVIRTDGEVLSSHIVRPSGNTAMDASVRQLLAALDRVPAPRDHGLNEPRLTVTIHFELTP